MKKVVLLSIWMLLIASCEQDIIVPENEGINVDQISLTRGNKIDVCHNGIIINVSVNALGGHQGHGDAVDMDGDGFFDIENNCSETDCDDTNAEVNPNGIEIQYNGIDDDCDPLTLDDDLDEDGYNNDVDCDDTNAEVNPAMEEVCDNGIDDNCNDEIDEKCALPAAIGDIREGGVVFWVDPADNTHGLVCALTDYPTMVQWGCLGTDLPNVPNVTSGPTGPGAEIGDGITNTNGILSVTDCPAAPAALAARSNGPEWFLPSAKELNQMYINKTTLEDAAGFTAFSNIYWSSTEYNFNVAWGQYFSNDVQLITSKSYTTSVRAVRAF